jgi:predicted DCC family thiol-disulfide oxidoreductase YuxK
MSEQLNQLLSKQPILLFDGECGFCNKSVQFFLHKEKKSGTKINFASLQSDAGIELRKYFEIDDQIESLIFIRNHEAYIKSCAALRLTSYMKGLWPLMQVFLILPPFLRNIPYNLIAKNRIKWFGKVEHCELLRNEDQKRFINAPVEKTNS